MGAVATERTLSDFTSAFNRHDLDEVMRYFADDAVYESPRGPDPWGTRYQGRDGVREGLARRFMDIPDINVGGAWHHVFGDRGASEWTMTGTTAEGDVLEVRGCDLWTFRDGLIVRKNSFWKIRTPLGR